MAEVVGALISEWLTPTCLFLLLNFVIATIFFTSALGLGSKATQPNKPQQPESAGQLSRAPSLFSRVTSFNFHHEYSHDTQPQPQPQPDPPNSLLVRVASFCRNQEPPQQELIPDAKEEKKKEQRKQAPEKKRCTEEEVDAKADDFINRFKQQLKLQRLESLLRYRNPAT